MNNHHFKVFHEGKKKTFKVSGSSTIAQVTCEVASAFDLPVDNGIVQYALKHKKSILDPSCPMRFAAIPSNAELALEILSSSSTSSIPSDTTGLGGGSELRKDVKLAISVEGVSGSITEDFASSCTLLTVIQALINNGKLDKQITQAGDAEVLFIRQKFTGLQLQDTTLATIGLQGLSGRFQIRFPIGNATTSASSSSSSSSAAAANSSSSGLLPGVDTTQGIEGLPSSLQGAAKQTLAAMNNDKDLHTASSIENKTSSEHTAEDEATNAVAITTNNKDMSMDVDDQQLPTMTVNESLQKIFASNFDSVSSTAIIITMKYLVNIIADLKEDKYRTINAANKVFIEKVSIANGTLDLLQSIGFKVNYKNLNKTHQSVFGRTDSQTEDNNRVIESLKLPHASDDQERLVEIFRQLESAAQTLNIPIQDRPILLQPTKEIESDVARNPIVPFDPMKPQIHRNAAQPLRSGKSATEEKLEMLQKRRRRFLKEACPPPWRKSQKIFENLVSRKRIVWIFIFENVVFS